MDMISKIAEVFFLLENRPLEKLAENTKVFVKITHGWQHCSSITL